MGLQTVKIPLLERVVLEELADRWQISADKALTKIIRDAALQEVVEQPADQHGEAQEVGGDDHH